MSLNHSSLDEKKAVVASVPNFESGYSEEVLGAGNNDFEVFKKTKDGVDFRTVGWPRASIIFLKGKNRISYLALKFAYSIANRPVVQFALGVLSIPSAMYSLG